jgi:hypothetical protein
MVCMPIDVDSLSGILRNSGGAIANMSSERRVLVQCPIRMPSTVGSEQTLEWTGQLFTPMKTYCLLRIVLPTGDLVSSTIGYSSDERTVRLSAPLGNLGSDELAASVRCLLPTAAEDGSPAGITSYSTRIY